MDRRNFFTKLLVGTAAIVVAPKILAEIKDKPVQIIDLHPEIMNINNIPISQWGSFYTEYERQLILQMQESMERAFLFGECQYKVENYQIKPFNGFLCNQE